jgi:hypothetical protein
MPANLLGSADGLPRSAISSASNGRGGDFMTDVLNSLGIEYLAINCAQSYRGLHEAVINHANNKPEAAAYTGIARPGEPLLPPRRFQSRCYATWKAITASSGLDKVGMRVFPRWKLLEKTKGNRKQGYFQ